MIPYGRHHIDEEDIRAVSDLLRSGWLTQGPMVEAFEKDVASYVGAKYAVAVSSATAGLHIAAHAAGLGPGDALLTSPITFVASANAAIYVGATPVFCDIDKDTLNISPERLREKLCDTPNVKVICPVHFGGLPCDMEGIQDVAKEYNAVIVEDAAHALGGSFSNGTRIGSCSNSDMTVFSFHPVKAIAAGEGGMITTNNEVLYRRLMRLRSHGINKLDDEFVIHHQASINGVKNPWYYEMQQIGYNYRITDIQCALGRSQFKKIDKFVMRRRELAKRYDVAFANLKNCKPAQPHNRDISGHHLYVLRIDFKGIGKSRAEIMLAMREFGVGSQVHYIPVPAHPYYRERGFDLNDYPASSNYYDQTLSIPLFFDLTDEQQLLVVKTITELVG